MRPAPTDLLLWVLLVPLCLLTLGSWEIGRASRSIATQDAIARAYPGRLARLRALAETDPQAAVDLGGKTLVSPELAVRQFTAMRSAVRRDLLLARAQGVLGWVVAAGAILAIAAGGAGIAGAGIAARQARISRDRLVTGFTLLHRALPILLGTMVVGLGFSIAAVASFESIALWLSTFLPDEGLRLSAIGAMLAGTTLYAAFCTIRGLGGIASLNAPRPLVTMGRAMSPSEAPALWRFVRDLAGRQQALEPDTIVVGLDGGFFVTERAVRLMPASREVAGRTLYLPAAYLALLDESEVMAIVGHELGHFVGADSRYSQRFAPLYAGLRQAIAALWTTGGNLILLNAPIRLAGHMITTFDHAVLHWSRLREFEADRAGSVVPGPRSAASALVRTAVIAPCVDAVLDELHEGMPEDDPDLVAAIVAQAREEGWPDVRIHLNDVQTHPTDTHPSTPDRVAKLGVAMDAALLGTALRPVDADGASAGAILLENWGALCAQLSRDHLDAIRSADRRYRDDLTVIAAAVASEELVLRHSVARAAWGQAIAAAAFALIGLAIWVFRHALGLAHAPIVLGIIFGACAIGVAFLLTVAVVIRARSHIPLLTLSPEALRSPRLDRPIAWGEIEAWRVSSGRGFGLDLFLADGRPLPCPEAFTPLARVVRKARLVRLRGYGMQGSNDADLTCLIERYIAADQARHALAARTP